MIDRSGSTVAARTIIAILLLTAAVVFSTTARANAVQQTIAVCSTPDDWRGSWPGWPQPPEQPMAWSLTASCPGQVQLQSTQFTGSQSASWSYPVSGAARITFKSVSFALSGGDGSDGAREQYVSICNAQNQCTSPIRPDGPGDWSPQLHTFSADSGEMPAGAGEFRVSGVCNSGNCTPGAPLIISDLRIDFDDDTPPEVWFTPDEPDELLEPDTRPAPLVLDGWNNGELKRIPISATDAGSGVRSIRLRIGGYTLSVPTGCGKAGTELPSLCAAGYDANPEFDMQLHRQMNWFKDGENDFTAEAVDGAGNLSPELSGRFLLDVTAPVFSGLRATSTTSHGWQPGEYLDMQWVNSPEDEPTSTQSGVASARYRIIPPPGVSDPNGGRSILVAGVGIDSLSRIRLRVPGIWRVWVLTYDAAGNRNNQQEIQVGVDPTIPDAPEILATPMFGGGDLNAGVPIKWTPPRAPISGICGYAMTSDAEPVADPGETTNVSGAVSSAPLYVPFTDGVRYVHIRAVSCAGVPGRIAHHRVEIDVTPPSIAVTPPAPGGWYRPGAELNVGAHDDYPGAELRYLVGGAESDWLVADELSVPLTDGRHSVLISARDAVGNVSLRLVEAGWDETSPLAEFEQVDPDRPALMRARIEDRLSGVEFAYMQIRESHGGDWRTLGTPSYPAPGTAPVVFLEGRIPDDRLSAGSYELRVVARDTAGHRTVGTAFRDGTPALLSLPLRSSPTLKVAIARHVASRSCRGRGDERTCTRTTRKLYGGSATIGYDGRSRVEGAILDARGKPLGDARLEVRETVAGSGERPAAEVRSGSDGRFNFKVSGGPSRRITVTHVGSETILPASASVKLLVHGRVSLKVAPRRNTTRRSITMTGRVYAVGARIPATGKLVVVQYRSGGRWYDLKTLSTDQSGRYVLKQSFAPTSRPVRWVVRAVVPWTEGWAYEPGVSGPKSFIVAP